MARRLAALLLPLLAAAAARAATVCAGAASSRLGVKGRLHCCPHTKTAAGRVARRASCQAARRPRACPHNLPPCAAPAGRPRLPLVR